MSFFVVHGPGDRGYLLEPGDSIETDLGVLELPPDVTPGAVVETHLGETFTARPLRGPDLFEHLERTGAPMMPRDIGLVIGHTGIGVNDHILDAGTGTGILAATLGRLGAQVLTYERDPEFADIARENMAIAGVQDVVEVRTGDVVESLETLVDRSFDVVTLDMPDAAAVVETAAELLVHGGFLAVYTPFVEHTRTVVDATHEGGLTDVETFETIQREMDFDDRGSRPSTAGVGHTGYLTFARNG